jgi:hypothetical protein
VIMNLSFVSEVVALLQQHQPWIAEKMGTAVVNQAVKELWDQVKAKLGRGAVRKVVEQPSGLAEWKILERELFLAADGDKLFASRIRALAAQLAPEHIRISQEAEGSEIKQVAVERSQNVKISVA